MRFKPNRTVSNLIIATLFLFGYYLFILFWGKKEATELKENGVIGVATFYDARHGHKRIQSGLFFYANKKKYTTWIRMKSAISIEEAKKLKDKQILILYSKIDPNTNSIYIDNHGYTFPDSVKWVLDYIRD